MTSVDSFLVTVGGAVCSYLILSTSFIGIVGALDWSGLFGLRFRERLWKLSLSVAVLATFAHLGWTRLAPHMQEDRAQASPTRFGPDLQTSEQAADRELPPELRSTSERISPKPIQSGVATNRLKPRHQETFSTPSDQAKTAPPMTAPSRVIGQLLWLTGLGALMLAGWGLVRSAVQFAGIPARYGSARAVPHGPLRKVLDNLSRQTPVRLLVAREATEPAAFGVRCWTIVLPATALRELKGPELRALLAHEVAHLVRRDFCWLWICRVLNGCLPIQPLNLVALRRWQQLAEQLCDDWAVDQGVDRNALASCLVQVAGWRLARNTPAAAFATGRAGSPLRQRVQRLVNEDGDEDPSPARNAMRRAAVFAAAVSCVVAFVVADLPRPIVAAESLARARFVPSSVPDSVREARVDRTSVATSSVQLWDMLDADLARLQDQLKTLNDLAGESSDPQVSQILATIQQHADELERRREGVAAQLVD